MIYGNHKSIFFSQFKRVNRKISNIIIHHNKASDLQIVDGMEYKVLFKNKNIMNEFIDITIVASMNHLSV